MTSIQSFIYAYMALWLLPFGLIFYLVIKQGQLSKRLEEVKKKSTHWGL